MAKRTYIPLENKNWDFTPEQVERVEAYYKEGADIFTISRALQRSKIEIAILIMDRVDKGCIDPRGNGLFGEKGEIV